MAETRFTDLGNGKTRIESGEPTIDLPTVWYTSVEIPTDVFTMARDAFLANKDYVAGTPTQAQALAQVDALTRQMNVVIKTLIGQYDSE